MDETSEYRAAGWIPPLYRFFGAAELGGAAFLLFYGAPGWGLQDAVFAILLLVLPLLIAAVVSFQHAKMIAAAVIRLDAAGLHCTLPRSQGSFFMRPGQAFDCGWSDIEKISWRKKRRSFGQNKLTSGEIVVQTRHGTQVFGRPLIRRPEAVARAISERAGLPLVLPPPLDAAPRR